MNKIATALTQPALKGNQFACDRHPSIRHAIGESAWQRLPAAVRARFADNVTDAVYEGSFDVVRASLAGNLLAFLCRAIRTPIATDTGVDVPAKVRVFPNGEGGMVWERTYCFANGRTCVVSSVKQIDDDGAFVEVLPAGLRMPLNVFEEGGALHFVSRGYHFEWFGARLAVPDCFPPGVTHVEHIDEGHGWFRFTMTVTHKWFGEVFFQTGRFRDVKPAANPDFRTIE